MPYADPRNSVETACKHLFRNLLNAERLRTNPLVSHFFDSGTGAYGDAEAIARIVKAVRQAAAGLSPSANHAGGSRGFRQRTIIERCELDGDPPGAVASELGLSVRQLYRERQVARQRIGVTLSAAVQQRHWAMRDQSEYGVAQADYLAEFGQLEAAHVTLMNVAQGSGDIEVRTSALCSLSEIATGDGGFSPPSALLSKARADLESASGTTPGELFLRARLNLTVEAAVHLFLAGRTTEPRRLLQGVGSALAPFVAICDQRGLDIAFRCAIWLARVYEQEGKPQEAVTSVATARRILSQMSSATPLQRIDLATISADVQRLGGHALGAGAREELEMALSAARRLGLLRRTVGVLYSLCDSADGEAPNRERTALAVAAARSHGGRALTAQAHTWAAITEVTYGRPLAALEHLRVGIPYFVHGDPFWRAAKVVESRAALAMGDLSAADAALSLAADSGLQSPRYQGILLAQRARLKHLAGKKPEARAAVRESLDLLRSRGRAAEVVAAQRIEAAIASS